MPDGLPSELADLAAAQHGALLGAQITAVVGDRGLVRLASSGLVKKLWHNGYVAVGPGGDLPEVTDPRTRLTVAALTLGRPVTGCSHTAAQLDGFDLTDDPLTHVLAAVDTPSHLQGLVTHRTRSVRPARLRDGHWVTDAAETAVRIAAGHRRPERMLAVLDRAMRFTGVDVADFRAVADDLRIRGIRLVREVLPYADLRAESPGESWLRWVCIEAGFPSPTPQVWVRVRPGVEYRVDLGWEELKVACEYDGVEFHTGAALTKDRRKYNDLRELGWLAHAATGSMIWNQRPALVRQVGALLAARQTMRSR